MGVGAYSSALLVNYAGMPFWVAFPAAGLLTALLGLVIGNMTFRLKGLYFMVVTFILGEAFRLGIANGPGILGGYTGLGTKSITPISVGFVAIDFSSKTSYYYLILIMVIAIVLLALRIDSTRYGKILLGIQQNEKLLESLGVNTSYYNVLFFVLSCAIAGMTGSFWAHYNLVISTDSFGIWQSIFFLVYCQLGGLQSVYGAIAGATFLTYLRTILRPVVELEPVIFGTILVISIFLLPRGLISIVEPVQNWINKLFTRKKQLQNTL